MKLERFRRLLLETVPQNIDLETCTWDEYIYAVCGQIFEDENVTTEGMMEIVRGIEESINDDNFADGPLSQPVIMRHISTYLDFESLKNFRFTCRRFKNLLDAYFYQKGTCVSKNSSDMYEFLKKHHDFKPKIKKLEFSDEIDLYEVSRIMHRCRLSLGQLTINTTASTLRGEFQNCAGVFPLMKKLHTLRLNLPRRYLFHNLFKKIPLKTINVIGFNFEQAPAQTISGIFNTCRSLQFMEVNDSQVDYLQKMKELGVTLTLCDKPLPKHLKNTKLYKIIRDGELQQTSVKTITESDKPRIVSC